MSVDLPPLLAIEDYVEAEGKLGSSIRWLITRVYEDSKDVPDKLRDGAYRDANGHTVISDAVIGALCNGSLYAQAAAKIFREPNLVAKSHGAVLAVLADYGIDVFHKAENGGQPVEESQLFSPSPFNFNAHMALIESLMGAHLKNVITVDRVIEAVSRHTCVEPSERPIDSVDALLFWINKICLLVRDEVEKHLSHHEEIMIPEMEDLYDDISDGQCLCALVHWYRPHEMPITDISFNESATTRDCQYNLLLLQQFCTHSLPSNPFHFDIEDLLYFRDPLQMNVNVFLADLFLQFEPATTPARVEPPKPMPITPRRFVPASAIHDLKAANLAARLSAPNSRDRRSFIAHQATRSPSMMSQDSLFSARPNSIVNMRKSMDGDTNLTNFQSLRYQMDQSVAGSTSDMDSLHSTNSIRLLLAEKRRQHEESEALKKTAGETERSEKAKAAFFAHQNQNRAGNEQMERMDAMLKALEQQIIAKDQEQAAQSASRLNRALSQPSVVHGQVPGAYMTLPIGGNQMTQSFIQQPGQPPAYYQMQDPQVLQMNPYASPTQMRGSLSNGMINNAGYMMQPQYGMGMNIPGMLPMQPQQLQYPQDQYGYQVPQNQFQLQNSPYGTMRGYPGMPPYGEQMSGLSAAGQTLRQTIDPNHEHQFHLHSPMDEIHPQAEDPVLDLNRQMTNWGIQQAYQQQETPMKTQRRTWQNETFIKSEMDLVNQKDNVPNVTDETSIQPEEARKLQELQNASLTREEFVEPKGQNGASQPPSFTVSTDNIPEDFDRIEAERRNAKKAAFLAKTMKRKEEIETKVDIAEQRNAEKKQLEMEKKDMAMRKKMEKEAQRQKILEEYKKKKQEKELGAELSSGRSSARGHSQPPFVRTKSNMTEVVEKTMTPKNPRMRGQSSVEQRVTVSSLQEPTHKLFAKTVAKSNRPLIINALQYSVFPGAVNSNTRNATMEQLAASSSKHFLVLFRDQKCQYRGLYTWDEMSEFVVKISGQGPPKCTESMMNVLFKYDSGMKSFSQIATKHLSATIDGFAIQDQYWQRPRIPHSGNATHRNN